MADAARHLEPVAGAGRRELVAQRAMLRLRLRNATPGDLPAIVRLLADDPLGAQREDVSDPLPAGYTRAFAAIEADPNNEVLVADGDGAVLGCLQLTYVPSLTYQGSWRAQVEGVRVAASARGSGIGQRLMEEAIRRARERGCLQVQLTTDKSRVNAHRFYERLGFRASHEGMKLRLD